MKAKLLQGNYIAEKSHADKLLYLELTVSADWCNTVMNQDLNLSSFISKNYVYLNILLAPGITRPLTVMGRNSQNQSSITS